jgi:hypothetical protein
MGGEEKIAANVFPTGTANMDIVTNLGSASANLDISASIAMKRKPLVSNF